MNLFSRYSSAARDLNTFSDKESERFLAELKKTFPKRCTINVPKWLSSIDQGLSLTIRAIESDTENHSFFISNGNLSLEGKITVTLPDEKVALIWKWSLRNLTGSQLTITEVGSNKEVALCRAMLLSSAY